MCEPIIAMPWTCSFEDGCPDGWHLGQYWIDADSGYSFDAYSDGDHDPVDEEELPSFQEVEAAWLEYSEYVLESGLDPLGEFFVTYEIKRKVRYQARIGKFVGGVTLVAIRQSRKPWYWLSSTESLSQVSDEACLFLGVDKAAKGNSVRLEDFADFSAFMDAISGENSNVRIMRRSGVGPAPYAVQIEFEVEERTPRSEKAVARELRALARDGVKRRRANLEIAKELDEADAKEKNDA